LSVPAGEYSLSVSKSGFERSARDSFSLDVDQTATLNFTLTVGATSTTVVVEASPVAINTTTANLGTAITTAMVEELPLNGRQFTQMLALTPGAAPANVAQNSGGGQSNALGTVVIPSINGAQNRSNYFALDGVNDTEVVFSSFSVSPIPDDIREFKVQSHNDDAQFGYVTGGTVNVVTKSGTNQYRGAVWEYLRNNALDARAIPSQPATLNCGRINSAGIWVDPLLFPTCTTARTRPFSLEAMKGSVRSPAPALPAWPLLQRRRNWAVI